MPTLSLASNAPQFCQNLQQRVSPPNVFNGCITSETRLWRRINACGGLMAICPGKKYVDPPWVKMPPQGKRFSQINNIPLPNPDGLEHLVMEFLVPLGYDGCIVSVVNIYTGTGFQDGSGDFTWRIQLNQRYVKNYGAITTQTGSLTTPYNINSGQIILQSNQLVKFWVNRSVASFGNENGGRIIVGLFGWYWPR